MRKFGETGKVGNKSARGYALMRKPMSFFGTGLSIYGYAPRGDGTYRITEWVTFLFLPVVPLSSWIIRPVGTKFINLGAAFVEQDAYDVVERADRHLPEIIKAYFLGFIAVAPVLSLGYYFDTYVKPTFKPPMETWLVTLFVVFAIWPVLILWLVNKRKDKAFDPTIRSGSGDD